MSTARRDLAQMVTRLEHPLKERLKKKAKAAGRTLNAEVVYRLDVEGRIQADLAAGRIPDVVSLTETAPAPAAAPVAIHAPAEIATPASHMPPELGAEAFDIVHATYDACTQDHADVVIPNKLGQWIKAFVSRYPRVAQ